MIAAIALALLAQTPPRADAPQAPPAFRSDTSEVLVDVVIRDKRGRLVRGLKPEQLQVFEGGVEQKITSFRERTLAPSKDAPRSTSTTAMVGSSESASSNRIQVERPVRLVSLVFERLGPEGRRLARQAALEFLKNDLGGNVYYAVFSIDRGFRSLQAYTGDRERLERAIRVATGGERSDLANNAQSMDRVAEATRGSEGAAAAVAAAAQSVGGPGAVNGGSLSDEQAGRMIQMMSEFTQMVAREDFGRVSVFSLWAVIKELKKLPGRKSILYFTEALEMPNGLWQQFRSMLSDANRANVTVYAIDAKGLSMQSETSAGRNMLNTATQRSYNYTRNTQTIQDDGRGEFRTFDQAIDSIKMSTQNALAELAESTGGFLIANTNDFRKPLQRLSEDFNTYYEISYRPSYAEFDGTFREITVQAKGSGDYQVQARNGYFALPPMDGQTVFPYEVPLLRSLSRTPLPRDLEFRSGVVQYRQQGAQQQALLVFDLPLKGITFAKETGSPTARTHLSFLTLIKDAQGRVVSKLSRDLPLNQPVDKVEQFQQGRFIVTRPVLLAPGRYTIETAVADQEGQRGSARKAVLVVPQRAAAPGLSDIVLLRRMDKAPETPDPLDPTIVPAGRVIPTLADTVPGGPDALLSAYFVIYAATDDRPRLVLDLIKDGELITRSTPALPQPAHDGTIPYLANLPLKGLAPGQYELRATVIEAEQGVQRSLFVNVQ